MLMRAQTAICGEAESFAIFLTLDLEHRAEAATVVRRTAAALAGRTATVSAETGEPALASAIGFGAAAWPRLFGPHPRPASLTPFEALSDGPRRAPATPGDIFVHIHSSRHDANFLLARDVVRGLEGGARLIEEIHGFRHLDGRDLTGFVDGTENAKGDERAPVALVGAEDAAFAGGSYAHVQRYVHDLDRWQGLAVAEQEAAIGRTKADDIELDDAAKPPSAHIARVVIEEDGQELEILRHSLPYGTTTEHGLYFLAYGRSPVPFRTMLNRMVRRDAQGHYDRLLDFTRPVTGAAFFMPSLDFLDTIA